MRAQKTFQFYSSSILIVYDARRLRQIVESQKRDKNKSWPSSPTSPDDKKGVIIKGQSNGYGSESSYGSGGSSPNKHHYKKLQRCHSNDNNYEKVCSRMSSILFLNLIVMQLKIIFRI